MFAFFPYLRNITYYLIVAVVVGMLAPAGKYKKFVSLVIGFILLAVMIAPLARFVPQLPATDWFAGLSALPFEGESGTNWEGQYNHWRNTYLRQAFEQQLTMQLEILLTQEGFAVHDLSFTFPECFSRLYSVAATVSREETPARVPFIRIQPVQITPTEPAQDCATATAAKNLISQFYNLPLAHISVVVR